MVQRVSFEVDGDNNTIVIAPGAHVSNVKFRIWGNNHHVEICEGCHFNGGTIWVQHSGTRLRIGRNTTIEFAEFALVEDGMSIEIGEDCMMAYDIDFRTSDSHSVIDLETGKRLNPPAPIVVGNHVWIARGAQIGKGVHIGSNSIIGGHSVVTKDVPANLAVAGIPARTIRENCSWHRELLGTDATILP